MPKARDQHRRRMVTPTPDTTPKKPPSRRPVSHHLCGLDHGHVPTPQLASRKPAVRLPTAKSASDELKTFATEGTPNTFSLRSSLSDLTVNSIESGAAVAAECQSKSSQNDAAVSFSAQDVSLEVSHAASLSSLSVDEEEQPEAPNVSGVRSPESSSDIVTSAVRPLDIASEPTVQSMVASSDGSWCDHEHHESAMSRQYNKTSSASEDVVTILSRNGSLSSLSVDSFGSTEPTPSEQALLEQCINSGMPKGCTGAKTSRMPVPVGKKRVGCKSPFSPLNRSVDGDKLEVVIPNLPVQKLELKPQSLKTYQDDQLLTAQFEEDFSRLSLDENSVLNVPKNGQDPSAVVSINSTMATTINTTVTTTQVNMMATVADVEESTEEKNLQSSLKSREINRMMKERRSTTGEVIDSAEKMHGKTSEVPLSVGVSNNTDTVSPVGSNKGGHSQEVSPSSDVSVDFKHQDLREEGDAMIQSLDKMTQNLLQQVQERKDVMKQSTVGSDTWNEDSSPNDVSFPSMSISAPLITSFKSDNCDAASIGLPELIEEDTVSMTDSHMLELEASKLAVAVRNEANNLPSDEMEHSMTSMDLDAIKPPSMMGSLVSLTTSLSGHLDIMECPEARDRENSSSLPVQQVKGSNRVDCRHRKKSLPVGVMMRRALGNNLSNSLENLLDNTSISSSCNSHLDNIKPPSAMEEVADMENSMVSVASITSEVADSSSNKEHSNSEQSPATSDAIFDLLRPAATIMAEVYAAHCANMTGSIHTTSTSDCLDNINPPSAFDEITDVVAHEPGTETICSDTEMLTDDVLQHQDGVDSPEYLSDMSRKTTPVQSADNSVDSTPKKLIEKPKQLTPKQKRLLVKDRYKTYTIDGEQELKVRHSQQIQITKEIFDDSNMIVSPANEDTVQSSIPCKQDDEITDLTTKSPSSSKVTPKQRRLEDRERFQTRVLNKLDNVDKEQQVILGDVEDECLTYTLEGNTDGSFIIASHTSELHTGEVAKTIKRKRAEAKERFQTRTLSEEMQVLCLDTEQPHATNFGTIVEKPVLQNNFFGITNEEIETLLERDANIVISSINETRRRNSESSEVQSDDNVLLDCETLSLISLESESDHNATGHPRAKRFLSHAHADSVDEEQEASTVEAKCEKEVPKHEHVEVESSESEDEDDLNNEGIHKGPKKPRIIKPGSEEVMRRDESLESNDDATAPSAPKPVRGRRKALYSNVPSKRAVANVNSDVSRSNIPVVSGNLKNLGGEVRPTRASTLRQTGRGSAVVSHRSVSRTPPSSSGSGSPRNTSPKTYKLQKSQQREQKPKMSPASKPPVARVLYSSKSNSAKRSSMKADEAVSLGMEDGNPLFKPPERQGTFTKDEPSTPNTPKLFIPSPSSSPTKTTRIPVPSTDKPLVQKRKKPIPPKSAPPTLNKPQLRREVTRQSPRVSPQNRITKALSQDCSSTGKSSRPSTVQGRNANRRSMCVSDVKPSLSNQSLNGNDGKGGKKSTLGVSQQSSSNCSLNSTSSLSAGKNVCTKKEVTSKIASLWKRVEESKAKQNATKDTHVWITADGGTSAPSTCDSPSMPSPPKLVRSSTFEGSVPGSGGGACNGISKVPSKQVSRTRGLNGDKQVAEVTGVVQPSCRLQQEGDKPVIEVVYRRQRDQKTDVKDVQETEEEKAKRLSRLGTFIRIEPPEGGGEEVKIVSRIPASAVVPPFNYNPPPHTPGSLIPTHFSSTLTKRSGGGDSQDSSEISDQDFSTASLKVTTV